jgi:hypothetical protein
MNARECVTMSFPISPNSPAADARRCDDLAATVVRRLEKRPADGSWGLLKTVLLGVPSFGLIPLLGWSRRFRNFAMDDFESSRDLAEWAALRGRQPARIDSLMQAAEETVPSPLPRVLSLIVSALIAGTFIIRYTHVPFSLEGLIGATYSHETRFGESSPLSPEEFLYRVWVAGLSIGYVVQWLNVRVHADNMKRFVTRLNPIFEAENLPAVRVSNQGWVYFRPLWIMTAVLLSMYGAWWGIPMALAGMAQRRYTTLTAKRLRKDLANRMRDVAMTDRAPGFAVASGSRRCGNSRCLAPLPPRARFCTRCGSKLAWMTNL